MKHMTRKKALSLFLSFLMIVASVPMTLAASPSDFVDFPTGWSNEAVTAAVENGLLNGRSANTIEPQGNLTRAEMATIINRAFGATVEADVSGYTDVIAGSWYYHEIAKAVNMETFQGDGDNTMRPDATITREEVFAVVARALVLETSDYSPLDVFADNDSVSDWAKKYAAILVAKGYVNGDDNGNLNPRANITREEFAQIMHNIIKTYYVTSGTYNTAGLDSALIRTGGVKLENVTINGDLILGDGVGAGNVELVNVTIKGRLLARGGEGRVTLTNTTVGERVVVKDVNGFVNFFNYRTEAPFANILEITTATFRKPAGGGGFSGGSDGSSTQTAEYRVIHYKEVLTPGADTITDTDGKIYKAENTVIARANLGSQVLLQALTLEGYDMNATKGNANYAGAYVRIISHNLVFTLYYDLKEYIISTENSSGQDVDFVFKHGTTPGENSAWQTFKDEHPDYTFVYTDENGLKKEITDDLKITDHMTLELVPLMQVRFHKNDNSGEVVATRTMFSGEILGDKLPTAERVGYELTGWNSAANGSGTAYTKDSAIDVSDVYAQWTPVTYTIYYDTSIDFLDGADIPETYNIETAVTLPGAESFVANAEYRFDGWYKEAEYINKITTIPVGMTGDITLYARWLDVTKEYKNVTFNLNYADAPEATIVPVEVGLTVAQPTNPERTAYTFEGWCTDAACTQAYDFAAAVNADITLFAKWTAIPYSITYETNGGNAVNDGTYNIETPVTLPLAESMSKAGYAFSGWYDNGAFDGNPVTEIAVGNYGDKIFYAKWDVVPYNITYDHGKGQLKEGVTTVGTYNIESDTITLPTAADFEEVTGYEFNGWYDNAAFDGNPVTEIAAGTYGEKEFYAKWDTIPYDITYDFGMGQLKEGVTAVGTYNIESDTITLPTAADFEEVAGFEFKGWYDNSAFTGDPVTEVPAGSYGDQNYYAKWEPVEIVKVTVTFYDGVVADDDMIINTAEVVENTKMSAEDIGTALDGFEPFAYNGYVDGTYVHKIYPELWYQKADGSWAIFDETVVVASNMNVYYAFKNLSFYLDLKLGNISESVTFSVPYETDTRIMDSIKDALTLGRNQVSTAVSANATLDKGDYYLEALAKAGEKTGIVDGQGNLKYIQMDAALHEIIDANEIDAEIKQYIKTLFVENTDHAKIDSILQLAAETEFVNTILGGAEYDYDIIKTYINGLSEDERIQLADEFHAVLAQQTFYVEFIEAYAAEHAEFHVTHESVDLIMALAEAVNDYTYEELKDRIYAKFGSFIDIIGDEAAEDFLRDAQDRYYEGVHAVWEDVHAHDDEASYESKYPSYLTFKLDVIEHFFKNLYPANREKAINKFKAVAIYHYADNPYLQQLIAATEANALLEALFVTVPKTDENIGYAFYPANGTESGFMHYYDYALELLKLFDKAMLWYNDNLTPAEMEVLKSKIFEDVAKAANKANEMLEAYEEDGSLPLGIDINKLKEIDAFAKMYDKVEDKIVKALDKFKTSSFYGKEWNALNVRTDIPYAEQAVSTLLGLDVPTFNIDSMMDQKQIFDKAGFTDYNYTGDAEAGTVTVQAIERILKGNIARVRRYYQ